uniref:RBR-type E3 ubiquitin transferase n=1 Tax=Kalanchoe fedtschenkoi TaxID=63787 RepID=A0A7N0U4P1_KALFE
MNSARRGRGRSRGGGRQQRRSRDMWTVKPSPDHKSPKVDTIRTLISVESSPAPYTAKPSYTAADGVDTNHGRRPRDRNRGKRGSVAGAVDEEVSSLIPEVSEFVLGDGGAQTAGDLSLNSDDDLRKIEIAGTEEQVEEAAEGSDLVNDVDGRMWRTLEELRLSCQEVKLTEEQLSLNDHLQEDELLAMESIYGENAINLQILGGLRTFQIRLHLEAPGEFVVAASLNSSTAGSDDDSYNLKVQYLPPIVLTCLLPNSYPSNLPPIFTISVKWLDSTKISTLCSMLDAIWNEQSGQEVIYQWAQWLYNSSLPCLGIENKIVLDLSKACPPKDKDKRAISGIVSPKVGVQFLKNYNDERCHQSFVQSLHQCCICFIEYPGTEFARLPCHHYFCWTCLKTYSNITVNEGTVNKLQCPTAKCGGMIPPDLLKRLLGEEAFERWESLTLQKSLESMSDVSYCPRCETACIEDEDHFAQCFKCFYSFCSLCMEKRHVGIQCMTPELKLQILQDRQNSSQVREDQKRKERDKISEILSVKEIHRDSKQCPTCNMAISRTEGCNKMVCGNCENYFCYSCGKAIDGYDHFKEGGCNLFTEKMVREWEERINVRQMLGQVQVEAAPDRAHGCPNCRQLNVKVGKIPL